MTSRDFNHAILDEVAHRPWPLPDAPWLMTQTWHDLLFAHWPVSRRKLRDAVPREFDLDLFDGEAWIGIVPFHMTNVAPRGVPSMPWVSEFPELNVRTYVRVGDTPGVYFFSLDAGSTVAVEAARALLNLPYYPASMTVVPDGDGISYTSERKTGGPAARFAATYRPLGRVFEAAPGTLEHFLTERYCLYHVHRSQEPYQLEIHHPPWPLQTAEAEFAVNTMVAAAGLAPASTAPLLHFAKRQDTVAWGPTALTA